MLSRMRIGLLLFLGIQCFLAEGKQKIISTSPALTELAYQLELGSSLIATSDFSDVPDAAKLLPRIGSLFHPSIEKTIELRPDWILVDSFTLNPSYVQALEALKLKSKTFRIENIEKLFEASEEILKLEGRDLNVLNVQKVRVESLKQRARPFSFLVLTWAEPAIAASRRTFYSSLFELIGGTNQVPAAIQAPYVPLSREWLLQNTPDYIFVLSWENTDNVKTVSSYFKKEKMKIMALSQDHFARTNFSGITGIEKMAEEIAKP